MIRNKICKSALINVNFLIFVIFIWELTVLSEIKRTIPNLMRSHFPYELVYMDFETKDKGDLELVSGMGDEDRPVQIEMMQKDGKEIVRAWFIASIPYTENEKGKKSPADKIDITFKKGKTEKGLKINEEKDFFIIDNSIAEIRIRNYKNEKLNIPLGNCPHWLAGMKLKGSSKWDGRAFFEGSSKVLSAKTQLINNGPVFTDIKIVYDFDSSEKTEEKVSTVKMLLGKQSFNFEPNKIPTEEVPKKEASYELLLRIIYGDPWVEVVEKYHLPPDETVINYNIHQYWIYWGETNGLPETAYAAFPKQEYEFIDTVMNIPWFEYDVFGGNNKLNILPAQPRPSQKGRPFALLRPRWNQGGGGAQEFFLTSGGADDKNNPDAPAFGIVAAYPSKWVDPYPATISAYADKNRNCARFPLTKNDSTHSDNSSQYYGARAYALCVGKRSLFDSTEKMNSFVRRHTDWTLVANINKYIFNWERKEEAKAPHILVNSEQLDILKKEFRNSSSKEMEEIKTKSMDDAKKLTEIADKIRNLETQRNELKKQISTIEAEAKKQKDNKNLKNKIDALKKEISEIEKKSKQLSNENKNLQKNNYNRLFMLLSSNSVQKLSENEMPSADIFLSSRYQDDSCNPTNYGTRRKVNDPFPIADLLSAGSHFGGANQAAIGYIFTDLDCWPGWHNNWSPGNPNFHTDKYLASIFAGASMLDHPHANEWLQFGFSNLEEDIKKVITAPDGAGYECPGYSGYSLRLQLKIIRTLFNCNFKNIPQENELFKKTARWHRKLITPYDFRLKKRHEAPLGDTHRWDGGLAQGFRDLAIFYKKSDPSFAAELLGTYQLLVDSGAKKFKEDEFSAIFALSSSIQPKSPMEMDWASEKFEGFGSIFRTDFGTERETFATFKAGKCMGHYHNDELTYHLYLEGSPVSLDYNCSYHPRGDHAVLHNSLTFGKYGEILNNRKKIKVEAAEQSFGPAKFITFFTNEIVDLAVAQRSSSSLVMSPIYPEDAEFGREYPSRKINPFTHRRWFILVKHPKKSKIKNYIIVYDETYGSEEKKINIHLLSRVIQQNASLFKAIGQYDKDFRIFFASETNPKCEISGWGYIDEFMDSPGKDYELKEGESQEEYIKRMLTIDSKSLPLSGWSPKWNKNQEWQQLAVNTKYQSLMPPPNWKESWLYGEYQQWLKITPEQSQATLWTLYALDKGSSEPKFEKIADGKGFKISVDGESEEIILDPISTKGQFIIKRDGRENVIIQANTIPKIN